MSAACKTHCSSALLAAWLALAVMPLEGHRQNEWIWHKSPNGSLPSGLEQQYHWLMNRARANPEVEGLWLAFTRDPLVRGAMDYFAVDLDRLRAEFAAMAPYPPAAFDMRLREAAIAHSLFMIEDDVQTHAGQYQRVRDAGFDYTRMRGAAYAFALSGVHGHCGFNIDWGGSDGTGMQDGRKHRAMIHSSYANAGTGVVVEEDPATGVGPFVTTVNYANADESETDHYNRFIVGTVWEDVNANRLYDPGEGIGGVSVVPDAGQWFAVTGESGGYAVPVEPGTYQVTYSGEGIPGPVSRRVVVGEESVLVPWIRFEAIVPSPDLQTYFPEPQLAISWKHPFGEPTALELTNDLETWVWADRFSSEDASSMRVFLRVWTEAFLAHRVRAWTYLYGE